MADLSNAYREQVRDLLRRRIQEARKRLLDERKGRVEAARKKAETRPVIVSLKKMKLRYDDLVEQIKALEKERDEVSKKFQEAVGDKVVNSYYHRVPSEADVEEMKNKVVGEMLADDPGLGPKLKELDELDAQISDLLILALTTTRLRTVVNLFNDRLGASVTDVERQILGIAKDDGQTGFQ